MKRESTEFRTFDNTREELMQIPRDKPKAALEAEKKIKKRKPRTSASGRTANEKG
jgi:hypothetical protein